MKNKMQLSKEICNLLRRRNKRQNNSVMLEMMMNKMTIDLNILGSFIKKIINLKKKHKQNNLNSVCVWFYLLQINLYRFLICVGRENYKDVKMLKKTNIN
jgi:hypothetical protein